MNPRTLRALLPAVRDAREAGVLEIEAGEGKNRIRLRLAPAEPVGGAAIVPGTDETAQQDEREFNPARALEEHYALHGIVANPVNGTGS